MEGKPALSAEDCLQIQDLLFRFMRSFDEKDWDEMRMCLAETVDCDYSSFRGTRPGKITRKKYIDQRKSALSQLKTQHNLSNIHMVKTGTKVDIKCNYAILRFHPDFDGTRSRFFHSYGQYRFTAVRSGEAWSISSIIQVLLMNDGNSDLHGALSKLDS